MKSDLIILYTQVDNSNELTLTRSHQVLEVFDEQGPVDPVVIEQTAAKFLTEDALSVDPAHPIFDDMELLKNFALDCCASHDWPAVRLVTVEQLNQAILSSSQTSELISALKQTGARSENSNAKSGKGIWGKIFQ